MKAIRKSDVTIETIVNGAKVVTIRTIKRIHITAQTIKGLKCSSAGGSKVYQWDEDVRGFGVYRTSKGRVTYVYRYRAGPSFRSKVLGTAAEMTVAQARDLARDLAYHRRQGKDPVLEERLAKAKRKANDALLVRNYAEDFIARKERSDTPFVDYVKNVIRHRIIGNFGDKLLTEITLPEVEAVGRQIEDSTGSSGRWYYVYIKQMFTDAERRDVIAKSPLRALEIPQPAERDRVLSAQELRFFIMAARDIKDSRGQNDGRGDQYEMLLRVPKRREEVHELPWEEIDTTNETWIWNLPKERSKNGVAQTIILPAQVRELLARQEPDPARRTGLVFARGGKTAPAIAHSARKILDANLHRRLEIATAAGLPVPKITHFTIHDLRTAVTTALQAEPFSVPGDVTEAMLNHLPPSKVKRTYHQHKFIPEVGEALIRWNAFLDDLVGDPDAWPGGADLPRLSGKEVDRRREEFTVGWPKSPKSGKRGEATDDNSD